MEELHTVEGRTVLVTGSTSGIGLAAATRLARLGANVIVHGPDTAATTAAVAVVEAATPGAGVDAIAADLSDQDEVRRLAADTAERHPDLDVLVNNAAAVFDDWTGNGKGVESTFAVNHLAPYLLTRLLLPTLARHVDARVVIVASEAHRDAEIEFGNLQSERDYERFRAYGRSKLANLMFNAELDRRLDGVGVTTNAMHPATVKTTLFRPRNLGERIVMPILNLRASSPEEGADTIVWLATASELTGSSGGYYAGRVPVVPSPIAQDEVAAARMWHASATLTGLPD